MFSGFFKEVDHDNKNEWLKEGEQTKFIFNSKKDLKNLER